MGRTYNPAMNARTLALVALSLGSLAPVGCSSTQIALKESFGYAKREQLVDRVEDARDSQDAAKEQFASALDEFLSVTGTSGGDLEAKYRTLKRQYDRSEDRAEAVRDRIKDVERVAQALFKEWESELKQYTSDDIRRVSERQLDETRARYETLIGAMRDASARMDPVLAAFRDQVLFLKHNLNAQAIASLQQTSGQIQSDVQRLVEEMQQAINEANAFIEQMRTPPAT